MAPKEDFTDPNAKEVRSKSLWSFVITKVEIAGGPNQEPIVAVEGYFVFATITVKGLDRDLIPFNLNGEGSPIRFILPPWFFHDIPVDEVCAKEIKTAFIKLMKTPFGPIPRRPLDAPIHRIPPSKRDKIVRQMMRQQMSESNPSAPEEEMES
jgi:hypothetical protein